MSAKSLKEEAVLEFVMFLTLIFTYVVFGFSKKV